MARLSIYQAKNSGKDDFKLFTFTDNDNYMKNLRNYILDVIREDYEENYTHIHKLRIKKAYGKLQVKYGGWSEKQINYIIEKELMNHFVDRFEKEFNHDYNKKMYPRIHRRIENYLLGLAYNFAYTYHDQMEQAIEFHNIKFKQHDESKEYQWGYRKVTGKTMNCWEEKSIRKHLYDMVSRSSGDGRTFTNYYFQMITQEIIKLLKKHELYTENLSL